MCGDRSSVNSRYQPRSLLFIGRRIREGPDQDSLLILHPSQLEAGMHHEEQQRLIGQKLYGQADCRNLLGHVERVSHDPVYARGDQSAGPRP